MGAVLSAPVSSKHLERREKGVLRAGAAEMQGYRNEQEDYHSIHLSLPGHLSHSFVGVYDGHSGSKVSAWLQQELYQRIAKLSDPMNQADVAKVIQQADLDYIAQQENEPNGSACIMTVFKENKDQKSWDVMVANVGDSRVILVKADGSFNALSNDHKPEDPEERKRIEAAGGTVSDNRVDGQLAMSRAMGDSGYKAQKNLKPHEQKVTAVAECMTATAQVGDLLLICCDGIVEVLTNEQVAAFLHEQRKSHTDPALLAAALIENSLKAGSKDNHTAVIVDFGSKPANGYARKPREFLAGPFTPYSANKKFVAAYLKDAAKFGLSEDEVKKLAKKTEESKSMLEFPMQVDPQEQMMKMFGEDFLTNPEKRQALQRRFGGEPEPNPIPKLSDEEQKAALLREKIQQIAQMKAQLPSVAAVAPVSPASKDCCGVCNKSAKELGASLKACGGCKGIVYCSAAHQKSHWKQHKNDCKK